MTTATQPNSSAPPPLPLLAPTDERAARADLLRQIARLEDRLAAAFAEHPAAGAPSGLSARPRLLPLADLERLRDALVDRLDAVREAELAAEAEHAAARAQLEAMYADPAAHRWSRITREQLGLKGCGHYHVRPRLGLVGMLRGWWVVKVSSGCPLAGRQSASSGAIVSPESASCSQ